MKKNRKCYPTLVVTAARPTNEWKRATVCGNSVGLIFFAYREPTVDINQDKMQFNFEDRVRQLTKQYPNDMELGSKIRELILNNNNKMEK